VIGSEKHRDRRCRLYAFTEQGVAMLSSVLRSRRAITVNIEIMRAFVKLRQILASNAELSRSIYRKTRVDVSRVCVIILQMNKSPSPAILVLTGASGAGKTTLILKLNELAIPGVKGINCDRVEVEGDARSTDRQADVLRYWLSQLSQPETEIELAVLDTQIRPHRALEVLSEAAINNAQIVLVDCEPVKRNERLHMDRGQPELANPQMDCWAAYLRGQADALKLSIIDTSNDELDRNLLELELLVRDLLTRARSG
jgi:NTP hydrolase family protein